MNEELCRLAALSRCMRQRTVLLQNLEQRVDWQPPVEAYEFAIEAVSTVCGTIQAVRATPFTIKSYFELAASHLREARDEHHRHYEAGEKTELEREKYGFAIDELDALAFAMGTMGRSPVNRERWIEGGRRFLPVMVTRNDIGFFSVWPSITINMTDEVIDLLGGVDCMNEATKLAKRLNDLRSCLGSRLNDIPGPRLLAGLDKAEVTS